jgi:hypothetical protein
MPLLSQGLLNSASVISLTPMRDDNDDIGYTSESGNADLGVDQLEVLTLTTRKS